MPPLDTTGSLMRSGSAGQGPERSPIRLVPQANGYAEYVDQTSAASRPVGPGQHRTACGARVGLTHGIPIGSFRGKGATSRAPSQGQRPIRSTIAWLLVLPLVTMGLLYVYAVSGTIGPATAKQNAATVNADIGAPDALMTQALQIEQA